MLHPAGRMRPPSVRLACKKEGQLTCNSLVAVVHAVRSSLERAEAALTLSACLRQMSAARGLAATDDISRSGAGGVGG